MSATLACPEGTRTVIFVGPSLAPDEAVRLAPEGSLVRPPVRFGDLYALMASGIETVLIVDGVFHGDTPVWQREILSVMQAGIRVVGAASMGALRALELAAYGMLGVGTVVEWYRDGVIEGDDEVALLHADGEMGYRALSLPLVDIRHALGRAAAEGRLPACAPGVLCERMKRVGHAERTLSRLVGEAEAAGLDRDTVRAVFVPGWQSLKAEDARRAIALLSDSDALLAAAAVGRAPGPAPAPVPRAEETLLRAGYAPDGTALRVADALRTSLTDTAGTARRLREASRRWFLADWCQMTALGPSPAEVQSAAETWLATRACGGDAATWLRASALRQAELPKFLHGRVVERWIAARDPRQLSLPDSPCHPSTIPLVILDWARRHGISLPVEVHASVDDAAAWVVGSGPGQFGFPDWDPDVAVARELMVEGVLANALLDVHAEVAADAC